MTDRQTQSLITRRAGCRDLIHSVRKISPAMTRAVDESQNSTQSLDQDVTCYSGMKHPEVSSLTLCELLHKKEIQH